MAYRAVMNWTPLTLALPIAAILLSGCVSPPNEGKREVELMAERHEQYMREFHLAQAEFERKNPVPIKLESQEHGTLIITACSLEGRIGNELVWVRFTYVNTTKFLIGSGKVVLTLIDTQTGTEWSEAIDMKLPFSHSFNEGSSFTSSFRMPTEGLHRRDGWDWRIEFETTVLTPEEYELER